MSDDATPRLALPYLAAAQAQKHVTVNAAMALLDGLVQTAVKSRITAAQPASPTDGDLYILPASPTGADWSGVVAGSLMRFEAGAWSQITPVAGLIALVMDEVAAYIHDGSTWSALANSIGPLQNLPLLGVGAAADSTNPVSVRAGQALFDALPTGEGGGGDFRLVLSKQAAANVLSLLFQDAYSGRAEIGLVGDDALSFKLSSDGSTWRSVLSLTATGDAKLDASLILAPLGAAPGSPQAGQIYFDSSGGKFRGYTGSTWADLN